jgi:hypothetical protein
MANDVRQVVPQKCGHAAGRMSEVAVARGCGPVPCRGC